MITQPHVLAQVVSIISNVYLFKWFCIYKLAQLYLVLDVGKTLTMPHPYV